ncbi:glycosyltransferase family A protein [Flavicella sp.]|uniref:glycosyltransferase family A protein n=1 Tax=Flavicella sp. TaxID=2957742 RepID=UPI00301A0D3C
MRIGVNPEKNKNSQIQYKKHRIIIPVYIPESDDAYFMNLLAVFKVSMNSLLNTIDINNTLITVINNNCKKEVTKYVNSLLSEGLIDKHVIYKENYGKVFTILSEARASYEDFITIADADVFYFNEWENKVFEVFRNFEKAGVVAPLPSPHAALYNNVSLFGCLWGRPKMKNVVDSDSFKLFEEGTNNSKIFQDRKYNWKEKQYYLEHNSIKTCVGSGHFIATYRNIFKQIAILKPKYVFKQADENKHLDQPFDLLGLCRLSTLTTNAYHLGNTIPNWVKNYVFNNEKVRIPISNNKKIKNFNIYFFKLYIFKFLKVYKLI